MAKVLTAVENPDSDGRDRVAQIWDTGENSGLLTLCNQALSCVRSCEELLQMADTQFAFDADVDADGYTHHDSYEASQRLAG